MKSDFLEEDFRLKLHKEVMEYYNKNSSIDLESTSYKDIKMLVEEIEKNAPQLFSQEDLIAILKKDLLFGSQMIYRHPVLLKTLVRGDGNLLNRKQGQTYVEKIEKIIPETHKDQFLKEVKKIEASIQSSRRKKKRFLLKYSQTTPMILSKLNNESTGPALKDSPAVDKTKELKDNFIKFKKLLNNENFEYWLYGRYIKDPRGGGMIAETLTFLKSIISDGKNAKDLLNSIENIDDHLDNPEIQKLLTFAPLKYIEAMSTLDGPGKVAGLAAETKSLMEGSTHQEIKNYFPNVTTAINALHGLSFQQNAKGAAICLTAIKLLSSLADESELPKNEIEKNLHLAITLHALKNALPLMKKAVVPLKKEETIGKERDNYENIIKQGKNYTTFKNLLETIATFDNDKEHKEAFTNKFSEKWLQHYKAFNKIKTTPRTELTDYSNLIKQIQNFEIFNKWYLITQSNKINIDILATEPDSLKTMEAWLNLSTALGKEFYPIRDLLTSLIEEVRPRVNPTQESIAEIDKIEKSTKASEKNDYGSIPKTAAAENEDPYGGIPVAQHTSDPPTEDPSDQTEVSLSDSRKKFS